MIVYVIGPRGGPYKIGITNNLTKRLGHLQNGSALPLDVIHQVDVTDREQARKIERGAHLFLHQQRLSGEWFGCEAAAAKDAVDNGERHEEELRPRRTYPTTGSRHWKGMLPEDFRAWLKSMGWSQRTAAKALGCSQNTVKAWMTKGAPTSVAYACTALEVGAPTWSESLER